MDINKLIDINYTTESRLSRRTGSGSTQEFFTPSSVVFNMCSKIPSSTWENPESNYLEPCFGNGNFLLAIIYLKIKSGSTWLQALEHTYGVELMQDNVVEAKERILELFDKMEISYDKEEAIKIMDKNLVCSDFFKWDFDNWRPIVEGSVGLF